MKRIHLKPADYSGAQKKQQKNKIIAKQWNQIEIKIRANYGLHKAWKSLKHFIQAQLSSRPVRRLQISASKGGRFLRHLSVQHGSRVESLSFDRRDRSSAGCHTDGIQTALRSPSSHFYCRNLWAGVVKKKKKKHTKEPNEAVDVLVLFFCVRHEEISSEYYYFF